MKVKLLSRVRLLATPWSTAYQAPLSMGFSRQEYWSGMPLPFLLSTLQHKYVDTFSHTHTHKAAEHRAAGVPVLSDIHMVVLLELL